MDDTPLTEHELEFSTGDTQTPETYYTVTVQVQWQYVDDSFDGHLYGRPHTFEDGHWEPEEWEIIDIVRTKEDGTEILSPLSEQDNKMVEREVARQVDDLEYEG